MGYNTSVTGRIEILPPLSWGQFKDSIFHENSDTWTDVVFDVEEVAFETDEGLMTRIQAIAVIPASEDGYKAYNIQEELQRLVNVFWPRHGFKGRLEGDGQDNGDMWRLYVNDETGAVYKVKAKIVWPEDEVDR